MVRVSSALARTARGEKSGSSNLRYSAWLGGSISKGMQGRCCPISLAPLASNNSGELSALRMSS